MISRSVTPLETLTDSLVHSQDIAVPLGRELVMDPGPSAMASVYPFVIASILMSWALTY